MKLYRIEVSQRDGTGHLWNSEKLDVVAPTAKVALSRAMAAARRNGFLKSFPIEVKRLEEVSDRVI